MEQSEPTTTQSVAPQTTQEHDKDDVSNQVEVLEKTTTFCPNWNCMNPDCQLRHAEQQPQHQPVLRPPYPMNPYFYPQSNYFYQTKHCKYGSQCHNPSCKFYHEQGQQTEQDPNTTNQDQVRHINGNHTESEVIQNEENSQHLTSANTNTQHVPHQNHQNGGYSAPVPSPCKFGSQCRHPTCRFMHPFLVFQNPGYPVPTSGPYPYPMYNSPILCRYGKFCNNPMCQFNHLDRETKPEDLNTFVNPNVNHMNHHMNLNNGMVPNHGANQTQSNTSPSQSEANDQTDEAQGEKKRNGAWNVLQKNNTAPAGQEGADEDAQSDWPLPSTAANMTGDSTATKKNCKYGSNCRNITNSKCKYSHPSPSAGSAPFGGENREVMNGNAPNHNFANRNRFQQNNNNNFMHNGNGNFRNPGPVMRNPNGVRRPGAFNGGMNGTMKGRPCRYGRNCNNPVCQFSHDAATENGVANGEAANKDGVTGSPSHVSQQQQQQQQPVEKKNEANEATSASAQTAAGNVSEVAAS